MSNVICTLPKNLIIGVNGQRRQAKYMVNGNETTIAWEDHERGLIAKNVPDEVVKILTRLEGYFVETSEGGKSEKSPVVQPSTPDLSKAASDAPPPSKPYPASSATKPKTAAAKK